MLHPHHLIALQTLMGKHGRKHMSAAAPIKNVSIVIFPKCSVADMLVAMLHHILVAMLYGTLRLMDLCWILDFFPLPRMFSWLRLSR